MSGLAILITLGGAWVISPLLLKMPALPNRGQRASNVWINLPTFDPTRCDGGQPPDAPNAAG